MTAVPLTLFTLAGLVWLLQSCAIDMHTPPPADWPALKVIVKNTGFMDVQRVCGGNLLVQYFACSDVRFDTGTCTIYTASEDSSVMEHELEHCKGRDHLGQSTLRDAWANWSASIKGGKR